MTQLGEMVAVAVVVDSDVDCPFHQKKHECDPEVKSNYREGNAEALGNNLHEGTKPSSSTVQRKTGTPDDAYRVNAEFPDPDKESEGDREVTIVEGDDDCIYPVAFAAHHLIPGRASLGKAKQLHKYLRKGRFCCNLGYDVDGNENGIWLPGLHAVNRNGLNLWSSKVAPRSLPDKEDVRNIGKVKARMRSELEASSKGGGKSKFAYKPLNGPTPGDAGAQAFRSDNLKWLYVQKSMEYLGPRQFHDAHPAYSDKVLKALRSVASKLDELYEKATKTTPTQCGKCKKLKDEGADKPPPPIQLLGLLNKSSTWYRSKLLGVKSNKDYYTSSWCGPLAKVKPRAKPKSKR